MMLIPNGLSTDRQQCQQFQIWVSARCPLRAERCEKRDFRTTSLARASKRRADVRTQGILRPGNVMTEQKQGHKPDSGRAQKTVNAIVDTVASLISAGI